MEPFKLRLQDLEPKDTTFTLKDYPDKTFTIGRWSLRVKSWVLERYTPAQLKDIFEKQKMEHVGIIAYHMLKEKDAFPKLEDFLDHVACVQDELNLYMALMGAIGIGEPEMKKLTESISLPEKEAPQDPNL